MNESNIIETTSLNEYNDDEDKKYYILLLLLLLWYIYAIIIVIIHIYNKYMVSTNNKIMNI